MRQYLVYTLLFLAGCNTINKKVEGKGKLIETIKPKYAQGFWIEVFENCKVIHVRNAYDTSQQLDDYIIASKEFKTADNATFINFPITKIACLSTTQIGFLDLLNLTDSIIAISDSKRIFNKKIIYNLQNKKTFAIGENGTLNEEMLLTLQPSIVFAYSFSEGNSSLPHLKNIGLKVVLVNDYNETHPLARSEWIKMIAVFCGNEKVADSIFNEVEKEYLQLSSQAQNQKTKPEVFCNLPWKEIWYMPSGKSYFAKFIEDAGASFIWKNDSSSRTLNLDFESVFAKASNADFWLNPNSAKTLSEIESQSQKFKNFKAFKTGNIFNCNKLENESGGNAFWESGVVQPNVVLKDLISIFHPEMLTKHELVYYQNLSNAK